MGSVSGPISRIRLGGGEAAYDGNGGLTFTGTQPASVATTPGTAAPDWTWTGATGGNTSIATTGVGGMGTDYTVTTGTGGVAAAAADASTGGRGGNFTVTLGPGGAANDAANIGTNLGGKGGTGTFVAGNGGAAANGSDTGGAGGDWAFTAGNGGNGDTGGVGGNLSFTAGNAGTGGNVNGGSIDFTAGRDTGSGAEGPIRFTTAGSYRLVVAGTGVTSIGANGTTNPAFQVDPTAASAATGLKVTAAAAASGVALAAISSGTDEALSIASKGAAALTLLTNSITRYTISATGAHVIAAPTSGTGLTVSGGGAVFTGNVGMGAASPQGQLHVAGAVVASTDDTSTSGHLIIEGTEAARTSGSGAMLSFRSPTNVSGGVPYVQSRLLGTPDNATNNNTSGRLYLQTRNNADAAFRTGLLIDSTGLATMAFGMNATGANVLQTAATAGGAVTLTITPGAHTAMTSTEQIDVNLTAHSVTFTDGQTLTLSRSVVFGATTYVGVAAGGTETVTTAITAEFGLPVQGANLTLTNAPISARFLGNVILGNILPPAAGPTNTLAIASGTAPTAVVADSFAFYSADAGGVAGYAAPHYIAETNALPLVVVGAHVKANTGDTANPFEGLIQINKTDNVAKLYADGGWRTIASGW